MYVLYFLFSDLEGARSDGLLKSQNLERAIISYFPFVKNRLQNILTHHLASL